MRGVEGLPLWWKTALRADAWRQNLGSSEYLVRAIRFSIMDRPMRPFVDGLVLGNIPQSAEDKSFAREDLVKGVQPVCTRSYLWDT